MAHVPDYPFPFNVSKKREEREMAMRVKEKEVVINDHTFTLREISIGEMMPILPRLEDPEQAQEAQLEMMRKCIIFEGQLLGDRVSELGISTYLALAKELMNVLGMSAAEKGKD